MPAQSQQTIIGQLPNRPDSWSALFPRFFPAPLEYLIDLIGFIPYPHLVNGYGHNTKTNLTVGFG